MYLTQYGQFFSFVMKSVLLSVESLKKVLHPNLIPFQSCEVNSYYINVIFANKPSIFNIVFLTQHICYWLPYVLLVSLSFFSPNMNLHQKDPSSFAQHGQRVPPSFNVAQYVYEN